MDKLVEENLPSFLCPITNALMIDPVIDSEGNSYEREAIEQWLSKNSTSPITRNPMTLSDLKPNRALKNSIEEMKNKSSTIGTVKSDIVTTPPSLESTAKQIHEVQLQVYKDDGHLMVSVEPPVGNREQRVACDICCVVDISSSMDTEATMKTGAGETESHGLSILDIVKHACKTIIHNLGPQDRFSLVSYSTTARVCFSLIKMDQQGKQAALAQLERLQADGTTNLWDGLFKAMEELRSGAGQGRNAAVLLLTDGQPNIVPPRGHIPMLKRYLSQNPEFTFSIHTFGFGYELDSKLLSELAINGKGVYAFIPDASFVGTAFVNSLSNILSTLGTDISLVLRPEPAQYSQEEQIVFNSGTKPLGGELFVFEESTQTLRISLGSLQFGQKRGILIPIPQDSSSQEFLVGLTFEDPEHRNKISKEPISTRSLKSTPPEEFRENLTRVKYVEMIGKCLQLAERKNFQEAEKTLETFQSWLKTLPESSVTHPKFLKDIQSEIEDQVVKAISQEFFTKWGQHYLPSLQGAHLSQVCNNFKDPGVQHYGGPMFQDFRDTADEIFCKLPPPKPTAKKVPSTQTSHRAPVPNSMSAYYSSSGPCFSGSSRVLMANGELKPCSEIRKGDLVFSSGNDPRVPSVVLCVLKTIFPERNAQLIRLGSLLITPYHPIKPQSSQWVFPCSLNPNLDPEPCGEVYSFLLDTGHILEIEGIPCCTLAHGFTDSPVITHPFFGTNAVIESLKKFSGWDSGLIELTAGPNCLVRDPDTGLVCDFFHHNDQERKNCRYQSNNFLQKSIQFNLIQ